MANESSPSDPDTALSAASLSDLRQRMTEFDELPSPVREALSRAHAPSDQMIDVLCTMHRSGIPMADLLRVVTASNTASED